MLNSLSGFRNHRINLMGVNTIKKYLSSAIALIICACLGLSFAYGLSSWSETRTFTHSVKQYNINDGQSTGQSVSLGAVGNDPISYAYTVKNTGNVPLTITVSVSAIACTAAINATTSIIPVNGTDIYIVTLTAFTGNGQCTTTFTPS